jgi:hypothetical protein
LYSASSGWAPKTMMRRGLVSASWAWALDDARTMASTASSGRHMAGAC